MIEEYIADICDLLDIDVPKISYDTSHFPTNSTMAMCDNKNTIYLRDIYKPNPDYMFSIAHELRHLWQIETNKSFFFRNYKSSKELSVEKYNLQIAEIDANAFAAIIMINWFTLQPQWNNLSDKVVVAINNRINKLSHELDL